MKRRRGGALVELVVASALLGVVTTACATLLHAQAKIVHMVTRETAFSEAARITLLALRSDLSHLEPARDLRAYARDSVSARIYRGMGVVCAEISGQLLLRYRGLRLPEPDKDSILVVGSERVARVQGVARIGVDCGSRAGEELLLLEAGQSIAIGTVMLVFESGTYSLANYALRYQRGGEGRQPMTAEEIDTRASSISAQGDSLLRAMKLNVQSRSQTRRFLTEQIRFAAGGT